MVALNSVMVHLLASRPQSPRTHCIAAEALIKMREPVAALTAANNGIAAAQGAKEPYHTAQLHLLAALAMEYGGLGGPTVPVAALSEVRVLVRVRVAGAGAGRLESAKIPSCRSPAAGPVGRQRVQGCCCCVAAHCPEVCAKAGARLATHQSGAGGSGCEGEAREG